LRNDVFEFRCVNGLARRGDRRQAGRQFRVTGCNHNRQGRRNSFYRLASSSRHARHGMIRDQHFHFRVLSEQTQAACRGGLNTRWPDLRAWLQSVQTNESSSTTITARDGRRPSCGAAGSAPRALQPSARSHSSAVVPLPFRFSVRAPPTAVQPVDHGNPSPCPCRSLGRETARGATSVSASIPSPYRSPTGKQRERIRRVAHLRLLRR